MNIARLLAWDTRLSGWVRIADRPGLLRRLAVLLAHSGDSWFWFLGLAGLWFTQMAYWQVRALALGVGVVLTAAVVMVVKFSIRRRRPEGEWGSIYRKSDPHSFPSGHAARAVMLALVSLSLGPLWLGYILSVWAPMVAIARVSMGVHYLSDVLGGMLMGAVMGWIVLQLIPLFP